MAPREPFEPTETNEGPTRSDAAVDAFWATRRHFVAGEMVVQDTGAPLVARVVSGWACEVQALGESRRQVCAFRLPGDLVVLRSRTDPHAGAVLAVSRLVLEPAGSATGSTADAGILTAALLDQNRRLFEQVVRLGALSAQARTCHLLLEFHDRLAAVGLVHDGAFRVPLTQEAFAGALGLSPVHVNRMLILLRREGVVSARPGSITIHDLPKLKLMIGL